MSDEHEHHLSEGIHYVRRLSEPDNRLGRLAAAMFDALEAHPEYGDGVKAIVMLDTSGEGTIAHHGYDEDDDGVFVALLLHLTAIAKANGMKVDLIGIPNSPEGL